MSSVTLENIAKRFGDVTVVKRMDLAVEAGEFIVLLGASGCGKSTVLRMIAGLETVSEGRITIGGVDVTHAPPTKRNIAMVFQNYALYPHMDVAENMSFSLRLARRPKAEIEEKVHRAARVLNIEHLLARKPKELSGGQRQRVAIGRAIVREPQVFLFDEPLSNLDAKLRSHMRAELALLHGRLGKTTVYVTHDQIEAMTLATRIVILDKGHIQQVGSPSEVFTSPANVFVAGFIGTPTMNLFEGRLAGDGGSGRLRGKAWDFPAPRWLRADGERKLTLGLRPQTLRQAAGKPMLEVDVEMVEFLGTESQLTGKVSGAPDQPVSAMLPGNCTALRGTRVGLDFVADELHVFDTESGERLRH